MCLAGDRTADAVRRLRAGGVLLLATDTLPGLHCRADLPEAVQRVVDCKGREAGKSLLVLAGSVAQAQAVTGPLSGGQLAACRRCWPGPFSLVLPAGAGLAPAVTGGRTTIAVRVPAVPALRELILAVGVPLVSTSANRAGQEPARDMAAAEAAFGALVDGVWGVLPVLAVPPLPSAVVDLTADPFRELRAGPEPFPGT